MRQLCRRSAILAVCVAAALLLGISESQAQCVVSNFTDETGIPGYFSPVPYSLAPDGGGIWDCFGNCGDGSQIRVVTDPGNAANQVVEINGGTFTTTNTGSDDIITRRTLDCAACEDGTFTISVKVKSGGNGTNTLWRLFFGTGAVTQARLQGTATTVFGKAGGGTTTAVGTLTGSFATVTMRVDTVTRKTEYYFNGTLLGVLDHTLDGIISSNNINRYEISRVNNAAAAGAGNTVYLDDIQVETCRTCHTNATPKVAQNVAGPVGGAVTPATTVYNIKNYGSTTVNWTASEALTNGTATDYSWMCVGSPCPSSTSTGGSLGSGANANAVVTYNTTGLAAGVYTGYIKFTDTCSSPLNTYLRQVNLFVGLDASCFADSFAYPNGELGGNGGWVTTGAAGAIVVDTSSAKIVMGTAGNGTFVSAAKTVSCPPCIDGKITVIAKIKSSGASGGFGWHMDFSDPAGNNFVHWDGQPGQVRGRTAGGGQVTEFKALSSTQFDKLSAVIDTVNHTTTYLFNDVPFTTNAIQNHGPDISYQSAIGGSVGQVYFDRIARTDLSGFVLFDDVQVVTCGTCGITILPDQNGRQINYNNYSAFMPDAVCDAGFCVGGPVEGDPCSSDLTCQLDIPAWDFHIYNKSSTPLDFSVQEVDASGSPFNYSWISLDYAFPSTRHLNPDDPRELDAAHIDPTGLAPGEYLGFLKFTDNCGANSYVLRALKLIVIAGDSQTAGHTCLLDSFTTAGTLASQVGWSGSAGTDIKVVGGTVRISAQSEPPGNVSAMTDVPSACLIQSQCTNQQSIISAKVKLQAGTGASSNIWQISFLDESDPTQQVLARFWHTGTNVAGWANGTSTNDMALPASPNFAEVEARINVSETLTIGGIPPNTTQFFFNGVPFSSPTSPCPGCLSHAGAGDIVTQVKVERLSHSSAPSNFLTLDDVRVDYCVPTCNDPVFDIRDTSFNTAPDHYVDDHDFQSGFIPCVTGPTPDPTVFNALPFECKCMDTNGDHAIDLYDFARFQRCYSGAPPVTPGAVQVDPACDN